MLLKLMLNTKAIMWRYNAIYAPPAQRYAFMGYGVLRTHELWTRIDRPVRLAE